MSTFDQLAAKGSGVGMAVLLEGSADDFATVAHYFSTHDGLFGGSTAYDPRIIDVSDIQRGFGLDGMVAASTVTVALANDDGGADFLVPTGFSVSLFSKRWRLKLALYDVTNVSDMATKTLGLFVLLDNPRRAGASVQLQLADDSFGKAAELATPPTATEAFAKALDENSTEAPVPLAFGGGRAPATPRPYAAGDTSIDLVVCATTDTGAVNANEVETLFVKGDVLKNLPVTGNGWLGLAREVTLSQRNTNLVEVLPLWEVAKTATLTKDGRDWQVIYVTLYLENLKRYLYARYFIVGPDRSFYTGPGGTVTVEVEPSLEAFTTGYLPALQFEALGGRLSSRTYYDGSGTLNTNTVTIRAPDIAYDLLRYYSRGLGSGDVDAASFTLASSAFGVALAFFKARLYLSHFGVVTERNVGGPFQLRTERNGVAISISPGILKRALTALCQGGFFDVAITWAGQFKAFVLANTFALQTATPYEVDGSLVSNFSDGLPSAGERWAPYNRVVLSTSGRTIDNAAAIAEWGVILTRTINDSVMEVDTIFSGTDFGIGSLGGSSVLESVCRPVVRFEYPLDALSWELGEYIEVTYGRGTTAVYSGTLFRIEGLTAQVKRGTVIVTAVWIQDFYDTLPYLLDDETLLVRSKGATSGDVSLSVGLCTFGGTINLTTMGVVVGDILVLKDSSQAVDVFTRFGAWRIQSRSGDFEAGLALNDEGALPANGTVANADWSIVRGATTYPTVVSDPTNYPTGGLMYGKQSESGTFSGAATANTLQNG